MQPFFSRLDKFRALWYHDAKAGEPEGLRGSARFDPRPDLGNANVGS